MNLTLYADVVNYSCHILNAALANLSLVKEAPGAQIIM